MYTVITRYITITIRSHYVITQLTMNRVDIVMSLYITHTYIVARTLHACPIP